MTLASWMTATISLASVVSRDAYGKATYEAPRQARARVESVRRVVRNAQGEESVSSHTIYTLSPVTLTDRLWLPGASTASADASNLPLAVTATPDKSGGRVLYRVEL